MLSEWHGSLASTNGATLKSLNRLQSLLYIPHPKKLGTPSFRNTPPKNEAQQSSIQTGAEPEKWLPLPEVDFQSLGLETLGFKDVGLALLEGHWHLEYTHNRDYNLAYSLSTVSCMSSFS